MIALLLWMACQKSGDSGADSAALTDWDGDGVSAQEDCDDLDASALPGGEESCDGIDNDCDTVIDEDPSDPSDWYADSDGDGRGDPTLSERACEAPSGYVASGDDCDDGDQGTHPSAMESCDGVDNDCDTRIDEEGADGGPWYQDIDSDGFGAPGTASASCEPPAGYVDNDQDCDDSRAEVAPQAPEVCFDGALNDCYSPYMGEADLCALGDLELADAGAILQAEYEGEGVGTVISSAGDVNGDGYSEILIGAPYSEARYGYRTGVAYLLTGPVSGSAGLSEAEVIFYGASGGDVEYGEGNQVGAAVAGGDLNGDGYSDVALGAPGQGYYPYDEARYGRVYLLYGPRGEDVYLEDEASLLGDIAGTELGRSLAVAGGAEGGEAQLLIGAPAEYESGEGFALLVPGTLFPGTTLGIDGSYGAALRGGYSAGSAVAAAGDIDGDGLSDWLISEPSRDQGAGAVWLISGPVSGALLLSDAAAAVFSGANAQSRAGAGAAGAGDVDGDGYGDWLVGAPGVDAGGADAGAAYLLSGPSEGELSYAVAAASMSGEALGSELGASVAGPGDVNQDGSPDLLIGAPGYSREMISGAGCAWLVLGPVSGHVSADARFLGAQERDSAGAAVAAAGDVDGDGGPDLLIGAPGRGLVYLWAASGF